MAKADDGIKELQRRLGRLVRLDGVVLRASDGPILVQSGRWDPVALFAACRAGPPTSAALLAALRGEVQAQRLSAATVARASRDLKVLAMLPWLAIVRGAPRAFRSFGALDERWLATREARLDALTRALQPVPAADPDDELAADPLHRLVTDLHGPLAAATLADWLRRSAELGAGRRREALRRIEGLVRRLLDPGAPRPEPPVLSAMLDQAAAELARLPLLPGRAAARRLDPILRRALAWPAAPGGHAPPVPSDIPLAPPDPANAPGDPVLSDSPAIQTSPSARPEPVPKDTPPLPSSARPVPEDTPLTTRRKRQPPRAALLALAARIREHAAPLVHALGTTRSSAQLAALRRVLGLYALAFPPDPAAARPPALAPDELEQLEARLPLALGTAAGARLTLTQALWLLRLPIGPELVGALVPWIVDGLDPALLERLIAADLHKKLHDLLKLGADVELAAAYAGWLLRLVPHYRRLGLTVDLPPDQFVRLHATHRGGLALLAHCLIEHHAADERSADAQLARLRATLGLFAARPRRAEALLAELGHAPVGRGRAELPSFAAWLGDTAALDRYCHLCDLVGEPVALSNTLRRDFDRHDRLLRQRDHLAAQPHLTAPLRARLAHLEAELARGDATDRGWTQRRLAERNEALQVRAFARKLDDLLRDVLRDAIGVTPPTLTPAWRDALRFYLGSADRNRALLGDLLRFAARNPGRPIAPTLARNQAWLARAAARMRTEPWLAGHLRHLDLGGERHTLCVEDDPLEVLRMGIAFDTCLDLRDGFNADSTVLNAVDVNKRVLYLRDARGSVIARKLIAVAPDFTLLGYRLYCARDAEGRPAVRAAVDDLCRALADACGLPLADHGVPEQIHPGFWYDDGAEPWSPRSAVADLTPFFTALGRPVPEDISEWASRQARAWLAAARGDVEAGLALLPRLRAGPAQAAVQAMLLERLGAREVARRARGEPLFGRVHVAARADEGVPAMLRAATTVALDYHLASDLTDLIAHAMPSPELLRAWLAAANHERRGKQFDDHGLAHMTTRINPGCLSVAEIFALCPELAGLWDWVVEQSPSCVQCRDCGIWELHRGLTSAFARAPDPDAVISALRGRHGRLGEDIALHLAARFSLSLRPCPLEHGLGDTWVTRLTQRPLPAPRALRALRELLHRRPALGDDPDMFAALVRQAGPDARHQDLPRPEADPFAALGELVLHLPDPIALLAPWLDPKVAVKDWRPDRWELHVHRLGPTPWRRRLVRRAAADDPHALAWLARLGDVATLERLGATRHIAIARNLRSQHALRERGVDVPADMSLLTAADAAIRCERDAMTLDLALLREAARALVPPLDPATLGPALTLLRSAELPCEAWHDIAARLLADPDLAGMQPLLHDLLLDPASGALPPAQLAQLAGRPALHAPLLQHLAAALRSYRISLHPTCSRLERAPGPDLAARDRLLAAFIHQSGDDAASIDTPLGCHDLARFTLCLRVWLEHGTPTEWLENYRELRDLQLCSRMIDGLLALPPARLPDLLRLRELVPTVWEPPHDDPDTTLTRDWLLHALASLPSEHVPEDSSSADAPAGESMA